ncbi:MAG: preprotein translocase subunit SecA [Spirochaetes bacterium]|nr:preprotein translocase subunit SecA [Spirochaetota bacterium]
MVDKIIGFVIGTKHERDIKKLLPLVKNINSLEPEMQSKKSEELKALSASLRERAMNGESLDSILPEAFALVRETSRRIMGMRHFDVQLMGGMVLHHGKISEMKTGEGKTLVATLAVYLNALDGKGVHVVTVNDYLARRDAEWMKPIYEFLGLSVGIIQHDMDHEERQHAYSCDITYGTNNEFGFDYLRDNMVDHNSLRVQRKLNFAIVDEVDSILIDEARTPLIISGSVDDSTKKYYEVDKIIRHLIDVEDFEVNEKDKAVTLTDKGVHHAEQLLKVDNLYDAGNIELVHHVNQALKAHYLFCRDVDYMVQDGQVLIIDEFTGRLMHGRRYSDGLHQALEAKEGVEIARESQTLASVTFQNYFRMYKKLAGMTGTADTEAMEFRNIYKLDVVVIPTNRPVSRKDHPDKIYKTEREKVNAIIEDILEHQKKNQPCLVGTISIEKSEMLSDALKTRGISHNVLNAKYHEREAMIITEAGRPGMVTIATNMAGRGTDIVLGGKKLFIAEMDEFIPAHDEKLWAEFKTQILSENFDAASASADKMEGKDAAHAKEIVRKAKEWLIHHNQVVSAGGLYILGTERHEARRIDNQLRGRSGRQGDPGESRFYLSLEDNLMRIFGSERLSGIFERIGMKEGENIESKMVSRAIESSQKRVEGRNFEIRKHLLEYDDVMNSQREYVYSRRNEILEKEDISSEIESYIKDTLLSISDMFSDDKKYISEWDYDALGAYMKSKFGVDFVYNSEKHSKMTAEDFAVEYIPVIQKEYRKKSEIIGEENLNTLERMVGLRVVDSKWREHLYTMDELRDGIWTVGYGERNPLVEYKLRGFRIFNDMIAAMKQDIVEMLCKVHVQTSQTFEKKPSQYREVGRAHHAEVEQFQKGGIPLAPQEGPSHHHRVHDVKPVEGGVKRKKTRRGRH